MSDEGDKRFAELHSIKKGSYIIVDGQACKVSDVQTSKTGKHGHAKARITAVGIVDGKKRVFVKPGDSRAEVPVIGKKSAQVLSIKTQTTTTEEGKETTVYTASVMDMDSYETFEMDIPDEIVDKVQEGSQVLYWDVMGKKLMQRLM